MVNKDFLDDDFLDDDFSDDDGKFAVRKTPEQRKSESISQIKALSESAGKPVGSKEIAMVLKSLSNTIVGRVNQLSLETTKQFLPITSSIQQVNDLMKSSKEEDQEKAFELIDKLQSRLGIDLGKYSKEIGTAVEKLYTMNTQRKEDKADAKRIHTEKVEQLKSEREILRERGINTVINEKEYKLEIRTKQQERQELKEIKAQEREQQSRQKDLQFEAKQIQKADEVDANRAERFIADQENLTKDQLKLEDRKEAAGIQPGERAQGFLSQTFGSAGGELKNFAGELKQIGKSLTDTFKDLPDLLAGFTKGIGTALKSFKGLVLAMLPVILSFLVMAAPFIAIGIAIGVLLYNLKAIINWFRESALGKLLGLDKGSKEREETDKKEGTGKYQSLEGEMDFGDVTPQSYEKDSTSVRPKERPRSNTINSPFTDEAERNIIIPDGKVLPGNEYDPANKRAAMIARGQIPRGELSKMSTDLATAQNKGANTNNVIAPSNNIINTNTTNQSMGLVTNNIDPTFLNLNRASF